MGCASLPAPPMGFCVTPSLPNGRVRHPLPRQRARASPPVLPTGQVVVYVDGVRVGEAQASEETPHHIIHRLCELDLAVSDLQQPPQQQGVGFRLRLPMLMQGKHEARPPPPLVGLPGSAGRPLS